MDCCREQKNDKKFLILWQFFHDLMLYKHRNINFDKLPYSTGATTNCGFFILQPSSGAKVSSRTRFLEHTKRRATVGSTPLDE